MNTIRKITYGFATIASLIFASWLFLLYSFQYQIQIFGISLKTLTFVSLSISIVGLIVFAWYALVLPYKNAISLAKEIINGNTNIDTKLNDDLNTSLIKIVDNFNEATQFSLSIGDGTFDKKLKLLNSNDGLGYALNEMSVKLQNVAEEERKRNWNINGIAKFGEILRANQDQSFYEISFLYIRDLVKYLNANQGGVYLINNKEEKPFIELIACFAFDRRKYLSRKLDIEEGLLAQCIIEKDYIYMDDVPEDYIKITSGLGDSNPRSILIVPLMVNEEVLGAIEIASFSTLQWFEIQFVQQVATSFAATVSNMQIAANTQRLLEESRKATEELTAKEEVLKANTKEMVKIQEALNDKLIEIEKESAYTQSIVSAINTTNASLVMDMDGNILEVNEMFLSIMEYTKEELIGKLELTFVAQDEIVSERYQMMIDSVRGGAFNSGEFKRISKSGRELWISGSYSPIFDVNGVPYKIILFAQFTTEQKERELELKSKIEAINNSIGTMELGLEMNLITANQVFLRDFGYKRMDLRNKKLEFVLEKDYVNSEEFTVLWDLVKDDNVISQPLKMITKDGITKHYVATFSPTKNLIGNIYKVLVILIDLTEQNLLREQVNLLLKEEKRKNALLSMKVDANETAYAEELSELLTSLDEVNSRDAISNLLLKKKVPLLELDEKQDITLVNDILLNIIGFSRESIIGESLFDLLMINLEDTHYVSDKILNNDLSQFKLRFKTIESNLIYFNVYIVRVNYEENLHRYVLIIMNEEPNIIL